MHPGNLNATPSIVRSAVLYVLRVWVALDLPLNEGLLEGVQIEIPRGILNPEFPDDPSCCPAVVGGIKAAIGALKERGGSSSQAIKKVRRPFHLAALPPQSRIG